MHHTLLLILIIVLIDLCGGWYGRGRWYSSGYRLASNLRPARLMRAHPLCSVSKWDRSAARIAISSMQMAC
jgi:hypothetical protein